MRTKEFPRSSTKADSSSRDDSNPKKKAIDLFCGAGGASEGLHRAGFEVTGVDIVPQPDYPFDFILADARSVPLDAYDFIWASPPCKKHTSLRHLANVRDKDYPDLVTPTCKLLRASGRPYCIENVPPAPLREDLRLCGTTFGLGTADGAAELRRHRVFEIGGFPVPPQPLCKHGQRPSVIGIYGSGKGYDRQGRRDGQIHPIPEKRYTQQQCDEAMGIGWMRMEALSQAVPPAYSQYIAEHFLRTLAVSDGPRPQAGKAAVTFRWPGGKAGLAPLIISHAPRSGRKFIDLFGGRGNVTFRAWFENLQFEQWILNDPLTTPFFRALRDYQNVERMVVPPRTREEFDRQAALAARGDQRALLLEPWLAFNGGLYSSGGFSTTGSRRSPESYKANLIAGHHVIVEKKPRITSLDWFDCLEAEELDERDFVMVDPSYVSGCVSPYTADSVVHCELIDVLKSAPFRWVMTEYLEPLYVAAFGEPIATKEVRNKAISSRVTGGQERRVECIWTGEGKKSAPPNVPKRFNETLPPSASLTIEQLLAATKDVVAEITSLANRRSAAHREKLLPLLIELKKRLPKGQFYSTLKKMGLTPSTVRVWHHRGRAADEIIDMLEEKPKKNKFRGSRDGSRDRDSNEEDAADLAARFLLQADKAIAALLRGDIDKAKRLGREYAEARQIQKGSDAHREVRKIA